LLRYISANPTGETMNSPTQKLNILCCSIMDDFGYRREFLKLLAVVQCLTETEPGAVFQRALEPR
jgi:hypothetical protein